MNEEDQRMIYTIDNLEMSSQEVLEALSVYFNFRANGYEPDAAYEQGVEVYMQDGEIPTCTPLEVKP